MTPPKKEVEDRLAEQRRVAREEGIELPKRQRLSVALADRLKASGKGERLGTYVQVDGEGLIVTWVRSHARRSGEGWVALTKEAADALWALRPGPLYLEEGEGGEQRLVRPWERQVAPG